MLQSIVFAMTSGQMWNHIRGPPYAHRNPQSGQVVSNIPNSGCEYNNLPYAYMCIPFLWKLNCVCLFRSWLFYSRSMQLSHDYFTLMNQCDMVYLKSIRKILISILPTSIGGFVTGIYQDVSLELSIYSLSCNIHIVSFVHRATSMGAARGSLWLRHTSYSCLVSFTHCSLTSDLLSGFIW